MRGELVRHMFLDVEQCVGACWDGFGPTEVAHHWQTPGALALWVEVESVVGTTRGDFPACACDYPGIVGIGFVVVAVYDGDIHVGGGW